MSERLKGILGAIVIVACFCLLGYLVHEKAEGAAVAAIAVVTTLVAWLTRPPANPPSASMLVPFAGVVTIIGAALMGCMSPQAKAVAAESSFREEQEACLRQYSTCNERLACRKKVHDEWGFAYAPSPDVCAPKDGGA